MDCQTARDRFSSLLEGELLPGEDKEMKDHLLSCGECGRELQKFEKTVRWLQSVEEIDAPEGFLSEVRKKLDERKPGRAAAGNIRERGFFSAARMKLPLQAAAMVAVLIVALYITKMTPVETSRDRMVFHPESSVSEQKSPPLKHPSEKVDSKGRQKPMVRGPRRNPADRTLGSREDSAPVHKPEVSAPPVVLEPAEEPVFMEKRPEEASSTDLRKPGPSLSEKEVDEVKIARGELKKEERTGTIGTELPRSYRMKESAKQSLMQERAKLPSKEIVLKVSDRDRVLAQLHRLTRKLGGNIVQMEENVLLASLPTGSFATFEKELGGLTQTKDSPVEEAPIGKLREVYEEKGGEAKGKEPAAGEFDRKDRVSIRIRLIAE